MKTWMLLFSVRQLEKECDEYGKKQFCPYCEKPFSKLPCHLQEQHHDEMQVQSAFSFPKNSEGRKKAFRLLRNLGNSQHNRSVLRESKGPLFHAKELTVENQ